MYSGAAETVFKVFNFNWNRTASSPLFWRVFKKLTPRLFLKNSVVTLYLDQVVSGWIWTQRYSRHHHQLGGFNLHAFLLKRGGMRFLFFLLVKRIWIHRTMSRKPNTTPGRVASVRGVRYSKKATPLNKRPYQKYCSARVGKEVSANRAQSATEGIIMRKNSSTQPIPTQKGRMR